MTPPVYSRLAPALLGYELGLGSVEERVRQALEQREPLSSLPGLPRRSRRLYLPIDETLVAELEPIRAKLNPSRPAWLVTDLHRAPGRSTLAEAATIRRAS